MSADDARASAPGPQPAALAWAVENANWYVASVRERIDANRGLDSEEAARRWRESQFDVFLRFLAREAPLLEPERYDARRATLCRALGEAIESRSRHGPNADGLTQVLTAMLHQVREVALADGLAGAAALPVVVGQFPVAPLEGFLVPVPGDGGAHVVAISESLPTYANLLGKALPQLLPLGAGPGGLAVELDAVAAMPPPTLADRGMSRFIELMWRTAHGRPADAAPYLPDPSWEPIAVTLRSAMESFIVARQFAHLCADHIISSQVVRVDVAGVELPRYLFTPEQEREADFLALGLSLGTPSLGRTPGLAAWGIDVLLASFAMLEVVERAGTTPATDRPDLRFTPCGARRAHLRAVIEHYEHGETLSEQLRVLDRITDACWANLWEFVGTTEPGP